MRCNLSKPSITQINSLKEHFGDTKIKQEIAVNPLPRIICHFTKA